MNLKDTFSQLNIGDVIEIKSTNHPNLFPSQPDATPPLIIEYILIEKSNQNLKFKYYSNSRYAGVNVDVSNEWWASTVLSRHDKLSPLNIQHVGGGKRRRRRKTTHKVKKHKSRKHKTQRRRRRRRH